MAIIIAVLLLLILLATPGGAELLVGLLGLILTIVGFVIVLIIGAVMIMAVFAG